MNAAPSSSSAHGVQTHPAAVDRPPQDPFQRMLIARFEYPAILVGLNQIAGTAHLGTRNHRAAAGHRFIQCEAPGFFRALRGKDEDIPETVHRRHDALVLEWHEMN